MDKKIESFEEMFIERKEIIKEMFTLTKSLIDKINAEDDMNLRGVFFGASLTKLLRHVNLPVVLKIGVVCDVLFSFMYRNCLRKDIREMLNMSKLLSLAKELQREMEKDDKD